MRMLRCLALAALPAVLSACAGSGSVPPAQQPGSGAAQAGPGHQRVAPADSGPATTRQAAASKVLIFVVENHSYAQMLTGMPYLASLAGNYAFAKNYTAITHPSLPNYLALAGGSRFGVRDDRGPSYHRIQGRSVFDQALGAGKTAKTYAESMPSNCALTNAGAYAVRHNPWTYFAASRARCRHYDVPLGRPKAGPLHRAIEGAALPNIGFVIPNICNDAHDCSLATADGWLGRWLPRVLAGPDFTSGRLTVVITADEDDRNSGNAVLTVVMRAGMPHQAVTEPLTHYSLLGYVDRVLGVPLLRHAQPGFARAFGL